MEAGQAGPRSCSRALTLCSLLQESWDSLLAFSKYNQQESFAVVYQPFFYKAALSPHLVSEGNCEQLAHSLSLSLSCPDGMPRAQGLHSQGEMLQYSLLLADDFPVGSQSP